LLTGDESALPVLRELLNDPSPTIRDFAMIGLKTHPEFIDPPAVDRWPFTQKDSSIIEP
jgi:hypothetical protein